MEKRQKIRQALLNIFGDQSIVDRFTIVESADSTTWFVRYEGNKSFNISDDMLNTLCENVEKLTDFIRPHFNTINE